MSPDPDPNPLAKALKRLASGLNRPEDIKELQQALDLGLINLGPDGRIVTASHGGVAIGGDVSGIVMSLVLPPEVLKLLQQPDHRPEALPALDVLADWVHCHPAHACLSRPMPPSPAGRTIC